MAQLFNGFKIFSVWYLIDRLHLQRLYIASHLTNPQSNTYSVLLFSPEKEIMYKKRYEEQYNPNDPGYIAWLKIRCRSHCPRIFRYWVCALRWWSIVYSWGKFFFLFCTYGEAAHNKLSHALLTPKRPQTNWYMCLHYMLNTDMFPFQHQVSLSYIFRIVLWTTSNVNANKTT